MCTALSRQLQGLEFFLSEPILEYGFCSTCLSGKPRDIESFLNSMQSKLYHMGFHSNISRSTLAYANETRDWRIYADFAQVLINIARDLYKNDELGVELDNLFTPCTRQRSIFAFRCFLGHNYRNKKELLCYIRCYTCAVTCHHVYK